MSWSRQEIGILLELSETGSLPAAGLARAAATGRLAPSRAEWLDAADRALAIAGVILLGAGLIYFLAYNWEALHRFAKLGLAGGLLAASVAAAAACAPFGRAYRAALLGACIATGALLALIGQTYQTGADVWELFAAWAALMTPFALLARSSACWLLWLVVVNAGLLRALSHSRWLAFLGALERPEALLAIAAVNGAVLLVFERFGAALLTEVRGIIRRAAGLGVILPLAFGACLGWWDGDYLLVTLTFVLTAGGLAYHTRHRRRDLPLLGVAIFAAIGVGAAGLARLFEHVDHFLGFNLIGIFVIITSAAAGMWLLRLHREENRA